MTEIAGSPVSTMKFFSRGLPIDYRVSPSEVKKNRPIHDRLYPGSVQAKQWNGLPINYLGSV